MPERFKFQKGYWYPHMMPKDIVIWERFIDKYPDYFDKCEYDIPVGSPPAFDTTVNPESGGSALRLYQRKIDVVGWKAGQLYIVEVKPRAGTHAVGQVLGYIKLYERDYKPATAPKPIVLTDTHSEDVALVAKDLGVTLIIV